MTDIRPATPADLDEIVEVFWACWTRSYRAFAAEADLAALDHESAAALWRTALAGTGNTLVAERAGRVVGLTRYAAGPDLVQVHSLYVHPDQQGGGIGGRLLAAALGDAPRGQLWVFSANQQGRGFYARNGWRPDGVTRTQERFGMPETRLVREAVPTLAEVAQRLVSAEICVLPGETPPAGAVIGVSGLGLATAGTRDLAGAPMTTDTWFDLASVTKVVTTVALLVLVSRGAVDLDAAAGRWWTPAGELTVRDLLTHRSGLAPWQPLYGAAADRDAALALALALPRESPGTYRYSDLAFMVLGEVVAGAAGSPLPEALGTLVGEPLGLDLRFTPDLAAEAIVAAGAPDDRHEQRMVATGEPYPIVVDVVFDRWRTEEVWREPNDGNCHHALGDVGGHAGLFGTVPTLLRLAEELARPAVLDPATVAVFTTDGPDAGQALGFRTRRLDDGRRLVFHPGFTGCALAYVPGGRAFAIGTNRLLTAGTPVPTLRLLDQVVALTEELA